MKCIVKGISGDQRKELTFDALESIDAYSIGRAKGEAAGMAPDSIQVFGVIDLQAPNENNCKYTQAEINALIIEWRARLHEAQETISQQMDMIDSLHQSLEKIKSELAGVSPEAETVADPIEFLSPAMIDFISSIIGGDNFWKCDHCPLCNYPPCENNLKMTCQEVWKNYLTNQLCRLGGAR